MKWNICLADIPFSYCQKKFAKNRFCRVIPGNHGWQANPVFTFIGKSIPQVPVPIFQKLVHG
ncbi:MAG: hypothetical protein V4447_14740 [Pseudomonadota bacterium]